MCLPLGERAFFIVSHEATVASNIGRKNGREPSGYAFAGQNISPVSVEGLFKLSVVHCSMGSRDPNALCGRSRFGSPAHKIPHRRGGRGILNAINVLGVQTRWNSPNEKADQLLPGDYGRPVANRGRHVVQTILTI